MVIYTREEKVLIIPEGEGCGCQGGGQPTQRCEREKREAYESGYTAGLHADCGEAIDEAYNSGYTAGLEACSGSTDCSSAITEAFQSGYTEGYNQGQADCPECSGTSCNLQTKSVVLTASTQTVSPDQGYDGMSSVSIDANTFEQDAYDRGYDSGYEDAEEDYPRIQNLKNYTATTKTAVISRDWGFEAMRQVLLDATPVFNQGYQSGLTACSGETPCDCSSAITEAFQSGYTEGYNDALYEKCDLETTLIVVPSGSTGIMNDITPTEAAGFGSVSVNATEYGEWKYQSGYTAGLEDCSGGTCPTETGLIGLDSGWSGYESYQPIGSGYFDEVIITDAGYGQAKFDQGYELGLATCSASSGSCLIEDEQTASLGYDWTGFTIVYPSQGYDGLGRVLVADLGYGQRKYDEGYADGHTSGYTEGYNAAITANCGTAVEEAYQSGYTEGYNDGQAACSAATEEAYESGVTEGQGSIFSVKVRWFSENGSWNWEVNNQPPLFIIDESGVSHTLNYQYSTNPNRYRRKGGTETDTPTGSTYYYEYAGYLQDGAKYIQPYQVQIPMLNDNLWNNNISGLSVEINGEVIHNWQTGPYGDVYDDWQFGSGAWRFTPLATVVSDTYYDATHKMVTFYIQGQVPNNN